MQTALFVIPAIASVVFVITLVRAFTLKPTETKANENGSLVWQANHPRSIEVYKKRFGRNHFILKLSLVVAVIALLVRFILVSM